MPAPPPQMRRVRQSRTEPETAILEKLAEAGVPTPTQNVRLDGERTVADFVWCEFRVVLYVDGCFWHACPEHGTWPKRSAEWWRTKLQGNRERDIRTDERLTESGWVVLRVCQRIPLDRVLNDVADALESRGWLDSAE